MAAAGLVAGNQPTVYEPYAGSLSPVLLSSLAEPTQTAELPSPSVSVVPSASPTPKPSVTPAPRPHKAPTPTVKPVGPRVSGIASWYCNSDRSRGRISACRVGYPDRAGVADLYAAAGPPLKRLLGPNWQGQYVVVSFGKASVRVRLVDGCACPNKVLDLYADAFQRLSLLSRGLIERVTVSRGGA